MKRCFTLLVVIAIILLTGCAGKQGQPSGALTERPESVSSGQAYSSGTESDGAPFPEPEPPVEKVFGIFPSISEVYEYPPCEMKIGTQRELEAFNAAFQSLEAEDIVIFAAQYAPSDYIGTYLLNMEDVEFLLAMLKEVELKALPPGTEIDNPATGGGTAYYIETEGDKFVLSFMGWDSITYPGTGETLIFNLAGYKGPAPGPSEYLYQKQQGNGVEVMWD